MAEIADEFNSYDTCLNKFQCGEAPKNIHNAAIFSPWVQLWIQGGNITYSVGNHSSPNDQHKTIIKSFQYGFSTANGVGAQFEFISEGGEAIFDLIDSLNKTVNKATDDTSRSWFKFGWITKKCNDNEEVEIISCDREIYLMGKTAKTTYENGFIKINYECIDVGERIQEQKKQDNEYGDSESTMPLKDALIKLFGENRPPLEVKFVKIDNDNHINEGTDEYGAWKFKNSEEGKGPSTVWPTNQENPLSIARDWVREQVTTEEKGIIIQYHPEKSPILYFIEDPDPGPNEKKSNCCITSIDTYVVNGGNKSPVKSFNPTIDWILINAGAGGISPAGDSQDLTIKPEDFDEIDREKELGGMNSTIQSNNSINYRSPNDTGEAAIEGDLAHTKAVKKYEVKSAIEAELKLIGDPKYDLPINFVGKSVSIIVIDPYYIDECSWIAKPICNPILTNKNWLIKGVSHQISEGNFETTLNVCLAAPNTDINRFDPLGGEGCGLYTPNNINGEPGD